VVFFATLMMTALTELALTQGVQLGGYNEDIRFPLTVSQCEPVIIYYSLLSGGSGVGFFKGGITLFALEIPNGTGYLEWICNIPAGYDFAIGAGSIRYYIVQPGSSASCLLNITTTYEYASYRTTAFEFYTRHLPTTSSYGIGATWIAP
jgi:hypothetical protein